MPPRAGLWLALLVPLSAAAEPEETLLGCRAIESASERVACYDRVVDRTSEKITPGAPAGAPRASSSEAPAPETPEEEKVGLRERLFGQPSEQSDRTLRDSYGIEAPREIASTVASVARSGDRLLEITLANGQVWRQEEYTSFHVRVGDAIEIKAGALGAYYLRRAGQGRTIRVGRVR